MRGMMLHESWEACLANLIRARRPDHDREGSYERRKPTDEGEEKLEKNLGASSWAVDATPRSLLDRGVTDVFQTKKGHLSLAWARNRKRF